MTINKFFKKSLSLFLTFSIILPTFSFVEVFAATAKPTLVSATATGATSVKLKWKKSSNIKGYEIYQKKAGGKFKKIKVIKNKNTISYKVSKLSSATKYTYKIRTYKTKNKNNKYSVYSKTKTVTTKPATPILTEAVETNSNVSVKWNKVSRATGYVIYLKTESGYKKLKNISGGGKTSVTVKGKVGDILSVRAYLTDNKKNIFSGYGKNFEVTAKVEENSTDNYVTEEKLQESIDEIKGILENSYVSEEKLQQCIDELESLFQNSYVTETQLEEYFDKIKESLAEGFVTEEKLQEYFDEIKNSLGNYEYVDITDTLNVENCYYAHWSGAKLLYENSQSCYMAVKPGEKFKVSGYSVYDVALALFYDAEGNLLPDKSYLHPEGKKYYNETVVIPQGCYYVAFGSFIVGLRHNILLGVKKYQLATSKNEAYKSVLYGKRMYADGDSVAEGAEYYSYVDFITDEYVMSTNKEAKSGTTLAVREGYSDSICERILSMDTSEEYDYILIEGGFNDMFLGVEIGELSKINDFNGYYNTSTVIGAMEAICHHLVNNYYESKKLFVLGHKSFGFWASQNEYWNAIISVLEKWGIPYVDLRRESNLCKRAVDDPVADKYFINGDGVHPTKEAYDIFYVPLIKAKLETL